MAVVVDASALAAVAFGEADGPTIAAHLQDETLVAPTLLDYELASVAWKKIRNHPHKARKILIALERVSTLPIERVPAPITEVVALAFEAGVTTYDAAYLWLASSRDAELVTLDEKLARVNQQRREPS